MLTQWNALLNIILIISTIISVLAVIFNQKSIFKSTLNEERSRCRNRHLALLKAIFMVYKIPLIVISISLLAIISNCLLTKTDVPVLSPTNAQTHEPNLVQRDSAVYLDEFEPLLPRTEAVITQEWGPFEEISIDGVAYQHGIGFRIPQDAQENYYSNHNTERIQHVEFIEYQLDYSYKVLNFDYGIDDSSFPQNSDNDYQCVVWIVVQSIDSTKLQSADENILFQTDKMNYRRSLHNSGNIDVSGSEIIRIAVFWEFEVDQSKQLALNVAIANPILYTAVS